jgi:chemotaxis protein histidine kinase CheA
MANKDNLALYLCQTGSVFCKFTITVMNANPDEIICNEGTQKFSSASTENDWGFNNVVKFDVLLDPKNGFWCADTDSISIEVGIVFVEAPKSAPVPKAPAKDKAPPPPSNESKINQEVAQQLLEAERLEALRKKLKQDISKTVKEEERSRKELAAKCIKALTDSIDASKNERARIVREQQERERKEMQERAREQERIRMAQEQFAEMKRKVAELAEESADIEKKKKSFAAEAKELKKAVDRTRQELAAAEEAVASASQSLKQHEKRAALAAKRIAELKREIGEISDDSEESEPETAEVNRDENELMNALRQSLAGILGN